MVTPPIPKLLDHKVVFGKVEGEDRGENPMDPPRTRNDPLFWLRDDTRSNPEVLEHLQKEAKYFNAKTTDLAELKETIYNEHISHIEETDMSAPYRFGAFMYYTRTIAGLSYKIHCRTPIGCTPGDTAAEQVILDENKLAEGKAHCEVRRVRPSESHDRIAYSVDFTGDEVFTIHFLDVDKSENNGGASFRLIDETVAGTNGDVVWGASNSVIFYTTKDSAKRDDKVWMRTLCSSQPDDVLLHSEPDTVFYAFCSKSFDGTTLFLGSGSSETSELRMLSLGDVGSGSVVIRPRVKGVRYSAEAHGDSLIILTNEGDCPNNKIVVAPRHDPANWTSVLVPHNDAVYLEDVAVFKKFLVVNGRYNGLTRIWTMHAAPAVGAALDFVGQELKEVVQAEPVYTVEPVHAHDQVYDAESFRVIYSSMTTPSTWLDVCPFSHAKTVVKTKFVGGGFDASHYICERRFATAPDGTKIPMSIVRRKDLDMSKRHPCMLYGYGSYGICLDPEFSISYLPYLDRGMVYAVAHVRGGGEMGRRWYEQGAKYLTKRNTFQDFISCAEELTTDVTTPSQLACEGRSAGGLLIGAVLNMRPDLFACAIAGVPFVDVLTTMCDPSIPLTTGEWEEWGNPNQYKYFDYMKSYSPIDNVCAQDYPHLFIHAGLHDPRVAYWEPTKWAAKLRMHKTDANDVLLKMEMDSGHFSASDRYKYWKEMALQQAFVIKHVLKCLK